MVAAATYRKREVEDEDEEAVHEAATGDAGSGGRRRMNPSHTQTNSSPARPPAAVRPTPAITSRGATPPAARAERWRVEEERNGRRD